MKQKVLIVSCTVVLMIFVGTLSFAADKARIYEEIPGVKEFSGQMIVRPVQEADWMARGLSAFQAVSRSERARAILFAADLVNHVPQTDDFIIRVPQDMTENSLSTLLVGSRLFQYAEPNWILYPLVTPNDPSYGSQWHHAANRMNSAAGWDEHTGDPSVSVGICDTGVLTTHEDLQLHRLEGYNAVDQQWESQGGNISPVHNHGTRCTGCAAGNGNNGVGISGVGWNLSHRMLRVSNDSSGSAALSTLQHAARTAVESGDRVASVSYSGPDNASNLTTATYIKSQGGLLVWAAGNDGRNLTYGDRDADDLIVVGATDSTDGLAYFSAYGQFVDLAAPGVNVYTTSSESNSTYANASGTSFATPLTAGLVALVWSYDPSLTPNEVEAKLKDGCDDLGSTGVDNTFGHGRIDVHGALVGGGSPPPPEYPTISGNNNYEYIARVQIGGIDNTSTTDPGGYGDYTAVSTDLTVGESVNCTLTPDFQGSTYSENWKVWIDFNGDMDFADAGEEVFYVVGGSSPVSGTITVPAGTAPITTRMRVVMRWNATPVYSGDLGYGEAEDYTVNIVEGGGGGDIDPPNPDPMTWLAEHDLHLHGDGARQERQPERDGRVGSGLGHDRCGVGMGRADQRRLRVGLGQLRGRWRRLQTARYRILAPGRLLGKHPGQQRHGLVLLLRKRRRRSQPGIHSDQDRVLVQGDQHGQDDRGFLGPILRRFDVAHRGRLQQGDRVRERRLLQRDRHHRRIELQLPHEHEDPLHVRRLGKQG